MSQFADLRENYAQGALHEQDVPNDPIGLFQQWFAEVQATAQPEPNAMTLATANAQGKPSARMVLLKNLNEQGFVFFTHATSRKGQEIDANPHAALLFWWAALERQVRIEGTLSTLPRDQVLAYFYQRPRASQLGALASDQSQIIPSQAYLAENFNALAQQYQNDTVPCPPAWTGYVLMPTQIEFWQGRPSRLHDRLVYGRDHDDLWQIQRLAP